MGLFNRHPPPESTPIAPHLRELALHYLAIEVRELEPAIDFYVRVLRFRHIQRPIYMQYGAWLAIRSLQIHLRPGNGTAVRTGPIDPKDIRFAFRIDDFEDFCRHLLYSGYGPNDIDETKRIVYADEPSGAFRQVYLLDPDRNVIEVNGPPL